MGNIAANAQRIAAGGKHVGSRRLYGSFIDIQQSDPGALINKMFTDGGTDPAGCTGDHGDFVIQIL